jgi:ABC-type multidrug transport system ATPase subunit
MKDTIDKDLLLAKIRLYFNIILVDREVSEKEVTNVVRNLLNQAGEHNQELVLELIGLAADQPGELEAECRMLVSALTGSEILGFYLDLLSLSFIDEPDQKELDLLRKIAGHLEIPADDTRKILHLFNLRFDELSGDIDFLSFGSSDSGADIPFSSFEGRVGFYKINKKLFFISLNSTDVFLNGDPITNNFYYCEFTGSDRVYFDGIHFGFDSGEIGQLFEKKSSTGTRSSWIVCQQQSLLISDKEVSGAIIELSQHRNKVTLLPLEKDIAVQISGNDFSSSESLTVFSGELISLPGLEDSVALSPIGTRNLLNTGGEEQQFLDLHGFDPSLPAQSVLSFTRDSRKSLVTLSGCDQQILKNGISVTSPVEIENSDRLLIGNVFIRIDLKTPGEVFQAKSVRLTNITMRDVTSRFKQAERNAIEGISLSLNTGELGAVMGPAGSGKSTLLNTLLGRMKPVSGHVEANGIPLTKGLLELGNRLGYVPQDDILIESLTTKENLAYVEKLMFSNNSRSRQETEKHLLSVLNDVGLQEKADSIVGSMEKRLLSGGERKRLNIALELVGNPEMLILDEPTSGLSSQDAEEIISLLRKLANQGKIVLMVIHQPSSVIYKMIDKVLILNKGGKLAHFGNAMKALTLFNEVSKEPNSLKDYIECPECREVNPDLLMKSLKTESTDFWRIVSRIEEKFGQHSALDQQPSLHHQTISSSEKNGVSWVNQTWIQFQRQLVCKVRDRSNILISFLAAPLIGIFSAFVFRFSPQGQDYSLFDNEQYPFFLFILVLVAIFLGLASSISEIIKDRSLLNRESLKNISIGGYFFSKFFVLSLFALVQSIFCVVPAQLVLQVRIELLLIHVVIMTLVSITGIATGLFFSTVIRSSVAAYNLVPLLLIPQIILGGAFLPFENMGDQVYLWMEKEDYTPPPPAQLMASRWAYEALVTANYDFHPLTAVEKQQASEKREKSEELNNLRSQGKISLLDKENTIRALNEKYAALKSKLEETQNELIMDFSFRARGEFLAPLHSTGENLWEDTGLKEILERVWLRNLIILILFSTLFYLLGFQILSRQMRQKL